MVVDTAAAKSLGGDLAIDQLALDMSHAGFGKTRVKQTTETFRFGGDAETTSVGFASVPGMIGPHLGEFNFSVVRADATPVLLGLDALTHLQACVSCDPPFFFFDNGTLRFRRKSQHQDICC